MTAKFNIPLCWKCANRITAPITDSKAFTLVGCKECKEITDYNSAQELCPVLKEMEAKWLP